MAFTKEAEKERFAKMPKAGIIERTLYKWARTEKDRQSPTVFVWRPSL